MMGRDDGSWILVAGYGSIGRRHFRNLRSLGCRDVRLLRSGRGAPEGFETPPDTTAYFDLDEALSDRPGLVIVANPNALHVQTARAAMRAGAAVFLEKPVDSDPAAARALLAEVDERGALCSMAYCFRYHPLYRALYDVIREGMLGRVFHVTAWQASYLPAWHPWEDYRESYAARADLGGGVVRTLDHDLDLIRWLFGDPIDVMASAGSLSGIGVPVEDTADMIIRFPDRLQAHVHVCFGRRDYSRGVRIAGERAGAILDWAAGRVTVCDGSNILFESRLPGGFDLNEMYQAMLSDALEAFGSSPAFAAIPLVDGVRALEVADAALRSSASARAVTVGH